MVHAQSVEHPVVELPVVDELQRAEGMGDTLHGVRQAVGVVIHGVDAPGVARAVVGGVTDAVERGVAHDQVWGGHVDFGAQHVCAVGEFSGPHAAEEVEVFFHAAVAPGAFAPRFGQGAAVPADFLGRKVVHIGLAHLDELLGILVKAFKIVGGVKFPVLPVAAQPAHVLADGVHVFRVFLGGIGVVKAQVALAVKFFGHAKVEADGFGVPQVQVAVGLRGKAGVHLAAEAAGGVVLEDACADKVDAGPGRVGGSGCGCCGGGMFRRHGKTPLAVRQCSRPIYVKARLWSMRLGSGRLTGRGPWANVRLRRRAAKARGSAERCPSWSKEHDWKSCVR